MLLSSSVSMGNNNIQCKDDKGEEEIHKIFLYQFVWYNKLHLIFNEYVEFH